MRLTAGLVAAVTLWACHPVGIVSDGSGPAATSVCDSTHNQCALGGGHGDPTLAYAAIAAVLAAPMLLKLLYPHPYRER